MTDEQIEKALECCCSLDTTACEKCPYFEWIGRGCVSMSTNDALTLIKLHRERIVALRVLYDNECKRSDEISTKARAEAIREFADKVTALVTQRYYFVQSLLAAGEEDEPYYGGKSEAYMQANIYIAEVLKEMTEEQE